MSHYTIDYAALTGDAKRDQAIADIKNYLGEERFEMLSVVLENAIADGEDEDALRFHLAFAGVRGYPVTAWFEFLKNRKESAS